MKFTNKWIVVPFNSAIKHNLNNSSISQIFTNKSLSNEEKLALYNNFILSKLRKNEINISSESNQKSIEDNNEVLDESIQESDEEEVQKSPISHNLSKIIDIANFNLKKREKSPLNTSIFEDTNLKSISHKKENDLMNMSLFNVPAAQNTRQKRKISNQTFKKILNKSIQKKRKSKKEPNSNFKKVIVLSEPDQKVSKNETKSKFTEKTLPIKWETFQKKNNSFMETD